MQIPHTLRCLRFACLLVVITWGARPAFCAGADSLREAVTFYASFDEEVKGDFGGGRLLPKTRYDHPEVKGRYLYEDGYPPTAFRINRKKGLRGGALEGIDVLPRRGRMFFPAKGNLGFKPDGWGGAVSFWLNTNPNTLLKTRYCDPVQITQKGAGNGGLWVDFPDAKPRDFRLGAFRGLAEGERRVPESDPNAPLIRVKNVGFRSGDWHHVLMNWDNFDTGQPNATAALFIDGKRMGRLDKRDIAMKWNIDRTGIYVAVSYIGLLDELALFGRALTEAEIGRLAKDPGLVRTLHNTDADRRDGPGGSSTAPDTRSDRGSLRSPQLREFVQRVERNRDKKPDSQEITQLRADLHRFIEAAAGKKELEAALALLLRLPAIGGRAPEAPTFPFDAEAARAYQRAYAKWTGLPAEITNRQGMTFVLVPPGQFVIGSPKDEPGHAESAFDESQRPVWLTRPFYLSKHETTVGQFRRFVEATGYVTDGEKNGGGHAHDAKAVWKHRPGTSWRKPGYAGPFEMQDRHPVVHVSHSDAKVFCRWLEGNRSDPEQGAAKPRAATTPQAANETLAGRSVGPQYDLPSEAQWEWACRAGSGTRFWWGADVDATGKMANVGDRTLKKVHPDWPREIMPMDDGHAFPAPVGSFRANAFGLHDMLGNVWEFCSTRYGTFPEVARISSEELPGPAFIVDPGDLDPKRGFAVRGGGWSNQPNDVRSATRNADPPHFCHSNLGFRVALQLPPRNLSRVIEPGKLPYRVHVVETYETDIEQRWWLRGKPETGDVPSSRSESVTNRRASRAAPTLIFDRKMGDRTKTIRGVVFNPVPGPPMGKQTRLAFRYRLEGTDTIKVQIYSLSNGYHRYLMLTGLPQGRWESAAVDMTAARRPDGSGGPLSEDERIDDIQFYVNPDADLIVDDIVLYDAAAEDETRPFPRRIIFTGWFDTGRQGREWPGEFEIVAHEKPLTWDAARSVVDETTGHPHIRVHMRGRRPLSARTRLRFRYRLTESQRLDVTLAESRSGWKLAGRVTKPVTGKWGEATVDFRVSAEAAGGLRFADEIHFRVEKGGGLLVDDLLLYEPGP